MQNHVFDDKLSKIHYKLKQNNNKLKKKKKIKI